MTHRSDTDRPGAGAAASTAAARIRFTSAAAVVAVAIALWRASRAAWLCDDAFISFRYARNLVEGLGLVFNEGERVEGYTNLLWTLWTALGLAAGVSAEMWSQVWGVVFYAGAILLLAWLPCRLAGQIGGERFVLPVAALGAALHGDWAIYATGGLETSLYTFLLTAGYVAVVLAGRRKTHLLAAGVIFGLAILTRPDGVLPASVVGLFVIWQGRPRLQSAMLYAGGVAALAVPLVIWRAFYYGDVFPNSYYAKSAHLAWYSQGWHYVSLYFCKYWILLAALPLAALAVVRSRTADEHGPATESPRPAPAAVLAAALSLTYTWYVLRVGGDFMFARLLIPTTPFFLVLLQFGVAVLPGRPRLCRTGLSLALLAALVWTPEPLSGSQQRYGVANEPAVYTPELTRQLDERADILGKFFDGLPVRMAFYGTQARLVYRSNVAYAVESETGLTSRALARQPIGQRGRVGHEKPAPVPFLVDECRVHFMFHALQLDEWLPPIGIRLGSVHGRIVHWDPVILTELKRRGAAFVDYPTAVLDQTIAELDTLAEEAVRGEYLRAKRFYFDHVDDPAREAAFLKILESP